MKTNVRPPAASALIFFVILVFKTQPSWAGGISQACATLSGSVHQQTWIGFVVGSNGCSYQAGDLMIAALTVNNPHYLQISVPSGWTNLDNYEDTNTPAWQYRLFYHIARANEQNLYYWGFNGGNPYSGGSPQNATLAILSYRGVNTSLSGLFDGQYGNSGLASSLMVGQSISPTYPDDDMITIFASPGNSNIAYPAPPMAMDADLSSGTASTDQNLWYTDENVMPPGPIGTQITNQTGHNDWIAHTYALAPSTPNVVYMSNSTGTDGGNCGTPQTACKTIGYLVSQEYRISPNCMIMFRGGDVWNEKLTLNTFSGSAGAQVVFGAAKDGSFGSGRPIIDGNNSLDSCVSANQNNSGEGYVNYVTIDDFECRNTTQYGLNFDVEHTAQKGIVISNNYVHNTGPFVTISNTVYPCDDLNYRNQINAQDDTSGASGGDGYTIVNNIVNNCGGHNCIQVHYDTGSPMISGNTVGGALYSGGPISSCNHNCIDVKGVQGATITRNIASCPGCKTYAVKNKGDACSTILTNDGPAGFYVETIPINANLTWENNTAHDIYKGFQIEPQCNASGTITANLYNNTTYNVTGYDVISSAGTNGQPPQSCAGGTYKLTTLNVHKDLLYNNLNGGGMVDINSDNHTTNWYYNDDFGISNAPPSGSQAVGNISIDPAFSSGTYQPTNMTVLCQGKSDSVTPWNYVGAYDAINPPTCP